MAARTLSPTLAAVVEDLELEQPTVVTSPMIRAIAERRGLGTSPPVIAARLRQAGWLLPTGRRGVWEFAPGAHAGPIGHGDPTLPLRALLATHPELAPALSLTSAAWALGHADRVPNTLDIAVPVGSRVTASMRKNASFSTFTSNIGYRTAKGVPCHRPESILTHLATTPSAPRSWSTVLEWLTEIAADLDADTLLAELRGRTHSVITRAGYLLTGMRPDLAAPLRPTVPEVVRFGARTSTPRRHVGSWGVIDYLLPSDPATWEPVL